MILARLPVRLRMAWHTLRGDAVISNVNILYDGGDAIRVDARDGELWMYEALVGWTPLDGNTDQLRSIPTLRISRRAYLERVHRRSEA